MFGDWGEFIELVYFLDKGWNEDYNVDVYWFF